MRGTRIAMGMGGTRPPQIPWDEWRSQMLEQDRKVDEIIKLYFNTGLIVLIMVSIIMVIAQYIWGYI